jgi:predicted outer membrane repeat protein
MLSASAALAAMITGLGGGSAQAAVRVPCNPTALSAAMTTASTGGTLSLAAGCDYVLTAGLPAVTGTVTITGNAATLLRSSAPGTPAFTILPVTGGNLTVTHLSFAHGKGGEGGAISVTGEGQLSVTGGTFAGNSAADGGAIYADDDPYAPSVSGAKFTGNTATGDGGAMYHYGYADSPGCTGCTFTGNTAGSGGAVFDFGFGGDMENSVFRDNSAAGDGGALALSVNVEEDLQGVTIQGNAAGGSGGGVNVAEGGDGVYLADASVTGNTAGGDGGGVFAGAATESHVNGTVIRGNRAHDGGGIWGDPGATVITSAAAITGNRATRNGGGVASSGSGGNLSVAGGQVTGNRAGGNGGGIWAQGDTDFTGTPITGNDAAAGGGIYGDGPAVTVALASSPVTGNTPDNCEPPGSVPGC